MRCPAPQRSLREKVREPSHSKYANLATFPKLKRSRFRNFEGNDLQESQQIAWASPVQYATGMTATSKSADDLNRTTAAIIKAAINVHRALGPGLFESAYRACLVRELRLAGFQVEEERAVPLVYRHTVLECVYRVDLDVDACVLVEVKAVEALEAIHFRQITTYLRLADYRVGLLMNFGTTLMKDGIHRVVNKFPVT